ncbi:LPXTG cell wall anchor domain-containing protein [Bradyrhizobium sp.]
MPAAPATITLPKTATNAELSMLLGLGILMLELIWLIAIRRRTAN